jgi:hypothetical protein
MKQSFAIVLLVFCAIATLYAAHTVEDVDRSDSALRPLIERFAADRHDLARYYGDGPLYRSAYLLGGMQLYALHAILVGSGKMKNRQFNDAVLRQNMIPAELIRASLTGHRQTRDYETSWKFLAAGPIPGTQ